MGKSKYITYGFFDFIKKAFYIAGAAMITISTLLLMAPQSASAAAGTPRMIIMSTSSNAVAATTTYQVQFKTMSTYTGQAIVIDFCTSPILGSTCTIPTGFTVGGTPSVTTNTAPMTSQVWTSTSANSGRTLKMTQATGVSFTSATTADFTINAVQNPTALGTFYARIYTYAATAGATSYTDTAPDTGATHVDDGGVALSTDNIVTVTAKIQETLTFCVFTSVLTTGVSCPGTVSGIKLGDTNGVLASPTTAYLSSTNASTPLYAQLGLASNATAGVIVRAKSTGPLQSGANSILGTNGGTGSCLTDPVTTSSEYVGFRVTAGTGGTGTQTADPAYACGASNSHSWDSTQLALAIGDPILSTAGPSTEPTTEALVDFVGKSSTTTKPGTYALTMTFIATGSY
ncbi:MAG: hypothetical protein JWO47_236 [Candidatus Saccharibacteria bacterium]|nr:hypothetical protein [Candidatus Saccharibacteria bacterium]